uniref:Uncharacterized protein n=1 Tax=Anguilla anguilla TaxID=7936 RepID=A0A0E9WGQ4_ANGAN
MNNTEDTPPCYAALVLHRLLGLQSRWRRWRTHLACFLTMEMYSCTSSGEPSTTGTLWWMDSGLMSSTFMVPVVAIPPACSMMKAIGLHSYSSLSFPLGLFTLAG